MTVFQRLSSCLLSTLYRIFLIRSTLIIRIGVEIHIAYSSANRLAVADRTCTITDDRQIFCWPLERSESINEGGLVFSELSLEDDKIDSIGVSDTHVWDKLVAHCLSDLVQPKAKHHYLMASGCTVRCTRT